MKQWWTQGGLPILLAFITTASAAPIAGFTPAPSGGGDVLSGGGYSVQACFDNLSTTDTGYSPTIQVVVPAGSTLASATAGGNAQSIQSIGMCATPGGCPAQFVNPNTATVVPLAEGETLAIVHLSLGSFAPGQPAACAAMSFGLGDATAAPIDLARNIVLTPIFAFGADALDNPTTDPPISGSAASVPVTPRLLTVTKTIAAPEGETATGPNYPRTVQVQLGVASGAVVTNVNLTDPLPGTLQYVTGSASLAGCAATITDTGTPSGATPGGTIGRQCSTLTGNGTASQLVLQFQAFVPINDSGGNPVITPPAPSRLITNTATANAIYNPPAPGTPTPVTGSGTASITAKLAPVRKSVSLATDVGNNGPSRLDTLRYRIDYDLSDFFRANLTVGAPLTFTDTLGDGQTFQGCADPGTTVTAFANGVTFAASPFPGVTCTASAKDPVTGETTITFDVGTALGPTYGVLLNGDLAGDAVQSGPTHVTVEFLAQIDLAYSATPFPGPGSPAIGVNDVVVNNVVANTTSAGSPTSDSSSASTTIGADNFAKSVYAYNGTVPPPAGFLVAAGDTVTYRIRWDLSVSSFEQGTITDFFPAPLFRTTGFNIVGDGAIAGSGTPPAAGRWTTGPADTFTTIGAVTAQVAPGVTISAPDNSVKWDYGTFNLPLGPQTVDLLVTVQATNEPFADALDFTNVASLAFQNSAGATSSAGAAGAIETRAPEVTIGKTITASSDPACAAAAPPANFDDARSGCDAADTVDFRITLKNQGRAPATNVRVDDDAGLPAGGFNGSCTLLQVVDGNNNPVATTGSLFDTSVNGGLSIATITADTSTAVLPDETVFVDYRCTIDNASLASLPDLHIDNTARLKYYSNDPAHVTDPAFNFASNQAFPGPNVHSTSVALATVTALVKAITASSVTQTATPNINSGETLTYVLTLTLAEGQYASYSFTDTNVAVPPINCAAAGFTCTSNVSVAGTTLTVNPTPASTPGTITYTYDLQQVASGTNTVSFSATNIPAQAATSTWTLGNPQAVVQKTFTPNLAEANDTVQVGLGWQNNNAANPMFQCVITDPVDTVTFDPATIVPVTTPAGYSVAVAANVVTYTATDTVNPCPDVPAGGATFNASLRVTAVAGASVNNTATLAGNTLPSTQAGGAAVNASGSATLTLASPQINTKVVQSTTEPDAVTAGSNVAIGERITYRANFTMPDGVTQLVRLVDDMQGGLANLTYVAGSAMLARNTTALTSANNPGGINGAAVGVFVPVAPLCAGAPPCGATQIHFDLGNVTNDPLTGGPMDNYTLQVEFQVANVAANTLNATRDNRGQVVYLPAGAAADQTINGGIATVRIVSPVVSLNKTVLVQKAVGVTTGVYTLTIANIASGPGAGPAFDWTFTDVLPPEVVTPVLLPLPAGVSASFTGNTLNGTIARLDPGQQVQVMYQAAVDPATPTGTTITNAASAQATSLPGPNGTGSATPGVPGAADGERTGDGGVNNLSAASAAPYTLGTLGIQKQRTSPSPVYAIGDEIAYELAFTLPLGTTTNVVVTDTLPPGLAFVPGSAATATTAGGPITHSLPGVPPTISGQNVIFNFGTVTASSPATATLTYRAVVRNVIANQAGTNLANSASLSYFDSASSSTVNVPAANPPAIQVIEPNLEIAKTIQAGAVGSDAGDPVDFRIVVDNVGNAVAHRVDLRDVLPAGLQGITNVAVTTTGSVLLEGTATAVTTAHAHVLTTTNPGDTLDVASLAPDGSDFISIAAGARIQVDFRAFLSVTAVAGQTITNSVRVPYASQANCPANPECRDGSGGGSADDDNDSILDNYAESASTTLTVAAGVAISKSVSPLRAPVGSTVTFTNRVSVIEGTTTNLVFTDVLPPGLTYVSHNIAVGNLGMVLGNPAYNTRLGAGQTVTFNLGNVTNPADANTADDFIEIEIVAQVDNIAANQDGAVLSNGEQASGSTVSATFGPGPTTVNFDADPATAGLQGVPATVIEPVLGVTKSVMPASQALGRVVTFRLDVAHLPASTSDAFDLVATDTLPTGLTFVPGSVNPPGAFVSSAGQVLTLGTGSLTRAAGTASVTYQATIDPAATVGVPLTNNARLQWSSVSGATGAATSGRTGTGGLNDYFATSSSQVTPNANAFIDATKTVAIAIDADASGTLTAGDTLEYTVTLHNTDGPASNVVFTDGTPSSTTYVPGSATTSAGTIAGTNPLVVNIGPMASNAVVTITFRVTVDPGTPGGTLIRNQGSVISDQTVAEPTDADGNDANGDQPTDILVSANLPGTPLLRAPKTVALLTDVDGSGSITQGDVMRYTISLQNLGTVPLIDVFLSDTIPADLTFVPGSATATAGAIAVTGQSVSWGPVPGLPVGATATAQFDVTITSVTAPSETYINQGTASSPQTGAVLTDGNASILDGSQPTVFVAVAAGQPPTPILDVQKRWILATDTAPLGTPSPGDTIGYTITVTNIGSGPATNVRFTDPVPACTGALNPCTSYVAGSLVTSAGAIVGTVPVDVNIGTLAIGASATISFRELVDPATANGVVVSNQASVTRDGTAVAVLSDDNGNPVDGLNPTLTPISTSSSTTPQAVAKVVAGTSEPPTTSLGNAVVVGEVVRYQVTFTAGEGTTPFVSFRDVLPATLAYVANSARLSRTFDTGLTASNNPGSINAAASGTFVALADGTGIVATPGPGGITTLTVNLGSVINSDLDANAETYVLEYRAVVANTLDVQAGVTIPNAATVTWIDGLLQPRVLPPGIATLRVLEPQVGLNIGASPGLLFTRGGTVNFTITLTNPAGANASPAFSVALLDVLPPIYTTMSVTSVLAVSAAGVTNNSVGTNLAFTIDRIDPGGVVTIVVAANAPGPLNPGNVPNTARVTWSSMPGSNGSAFDGVATPGIPGSPTGERIGVVGTANDYVTVAAAALLIASPAIPTLANWVLALMALVMMGIGVHALRARRGGEWRRRGVSG